MRPLFAARPGPTSRSLLVTGSFLLPAEGPGALRIQVLAASLSGIMISAGSDTKGSLRIDLRVRLPRAFKFSPRRARPIRTAPTYVPHGDGGPPVGRTLGWDG